MDFFKRRDQLNLNDKFLVPQAVCGTFSFTNPLLWPRKIDEYSTNLKIEMHIIFAHTIIKIYEYLFCIPAILHRHQLKETKPVAIAEFVKTWGNN